jgi:predicted MFS family arabinose efflux permease
MRRRERSELTVVLLVAAVQFTNILDFVMVMPLGPDFAAALAIPLSTLGYIGGAYTFSAAFAGLAGSLFLDRFDRRKALGVAMLGLVIGTALGGFAAQLAHWAPIELFAHWIDRPAPLVALMFARVVAGAFGGPATSISISIIADVVPPERRGKAMGMVMGAFAAASVLGVPAGLELARRGGWRMPFFGVSAIGLVIGFSAIFLLPPLTGHLAAAMARKRLAFLQLFTRPIALLSWTTTATVMMAGFILIPNISAYVQGNLDYPRARIGVLYGAGGVLSLFATQIGGRIVDRIGSAKTALVGSVAVLCVVYIGFVISPPPIPIVALFMCFMTAMGLRNVSYQTLASRVPEPAERAGFMSIQSAVQHFASSAGAFLSAYLLTEQSGKLIGMPTVAKISMGLSAVVPVLLFVLEKQVVDRDLSRATAPKSDPLAVIVGPASGAPVAAPLPGAQHP